MFKTGDLVKATKSVIADFYGGLELYRRGRRYRLKAGELDLVNDYKDCFILIKKA